MRAMLMALSVLVNGVRSTRAAHTTCGSLGIMAVDKSTLPPSVDAEHIRECLDHPEAKQLQPRLGLELVERACWEGGTQLGCSKEGYCWKVCGPQGQWCWTAYNSGFGEWIRCSGAKDCNTGMSCGQGGDDCKACGCSC
ncbi:hypothetical protein E4U21_006472 [Claviceps maximensis]|nr:hypothetical protein E4U21_006472 [Claviceps maximensis]